MLFSFLIASASAGPTNTAGIDRVNITNRCGVDGAVDHEFMVTLKPPPADSNGRRLDTTQDKLSYLQGWVHQYDAEDTSNDTKPRTTPSEANSDSTQILHLFALTQLAVVISASDDVRHAPNTCPCLASPSPPRRILTIHNSVPHDSHGPTCTHQTIALMAEDPAVSSIEVDCLQRADTSLPESDSSSPGDHDMDQVEAAARRLSVQVGATTLSLTHPRLRRRSHISLDALLPSDRQR